MKQKIVIDGRTFVLVPSDAEDEDCGDRNPCRGCCADRHGYPTPLCEKLPDCSDAEHSYIWKEVKDETGDR